MNKLYKNSDRYKFIEILEYRDEYYLVSIDIINFKSINDMFGFYNGDILLYQIIEYIESLSNDKFKLNVCRYESDIIMVMIDSIYEDDVFEIVNKIIYHTYKYDVDFRVGYKEMDSNSNLNRFLESITYVIKDKKYTVDKPFDKSFRLNDDIKKYFAIKQDIMFNNSSNFKLVYQPKISNKYKVINSCEVLSRWSNPKVGQSPPNEFLSIIKHLDKEVEFDLMIFEKACIELSGEEEIINKFSINVSIKSIVNNNFLNEIDKLLRKYNINSKNVTLEILEDICDYNHIEISKNIDRLVNLGFSISIDDFGTGYSSYSRLAGLNFSEVKIPREFLILESKSVVNRNKKILSGIVSMCRSLNCEIVIEGVETEEDIKLAQMLNIDYIQGYYYSKPLSKLDYIEFVNEYENKRLQCG
ncbi:MAG: GGDEF domain-containing phosphodiesterase [Peptostreptococcaceae bacterium]